MARPAYPDLQDIAYSFALCFGVEALALSLSTALGFSPLTIQLIAVLAGYLSFVLVCLYGYKARQGNLKPLLGRGERLFDDFRLAFLYYLVSYPAVLLISFITLNLLHAMGYNIEAQQWAVQSFLNSKDHLFLRLNQLFVLAIVTPFIEEFFFRGIFFSFLRKYLNLWPTLLLSSLFFSMMHYTPEQGVRNFDILGGLFILSLFLGLLYEKQHSLAAPFFLHSLFNLTALLLLMFYG